MSEIETVGAQAKARKFTLRFDFIKSYLGIGFLNLREPHRYKLTQDEIDSAVIKGDTVGVYWDEEKKYGPIRISTRSMKVTNDPKTFDAVQTLQKKKENSEDIPAQDNSLFHEIDKDRIYLTDVTTQHHLSIILNIQSNQRTLVVAPYFGSSSKMDITIDQLVENGTLRNGCVDFIHESGTNEGPFFYERTVTICDPELVQAFKALKELN
jgi:hypothetical protein